MLSDLPLSNEFLSQKIIAIDNTTKKRKWEDSGNFTHCESSIMSPSNRAGIKQLESQGGPYKSLYGSSDQLIIIGDGDATADNGFYDLSGKILRGRPFVNVNHSAELCGNEQLVSGNRDELTTPVTLTTLDSASILDDNYLYGHIDELGQLMSSGCYPVELAITSPPNAQPTSCSTCLADHCIRHYSNQDADHLDPYTTGFPCAAPVHSNQTYNENPIHTVNPYYCKEQSAEMGSGVAHALPFTWMSGTDGGESLQCHLSDTNDLFATLHSSDCASQMASTLSTNESDVRETPMDEVCTSCELNESVTYMGQQRKDESITKVDSYSMDAQEGLRRDRLTGKFKQSTHSKQPTSSEKFCKVCGDRAVNHNFGQLTCESCKAFFRRNAHKELTCTSKTGEHEITPATRRECPACRLKKCFMVGMRPDLIQVRKKDGSKPRWLDKVPSAAIVHEKHCTQATELATKSCLPFEAKQKHSAAEFGPSKHVRECCDDVCSTDSGSCISINTSAVTAMLVDNVTGSLGGNGPTVERLDGDETVWSAKHAIPNPQIQLPIAVTEASDFPQLHHPNVDLSKRLADSQLATCQIHLDQIDYEATLEETKDKLLASETLVPLSEKCTPTANCTEAANSSCSQAFTGETESFQPMCIAKTLETGPCFQKDPALASSVNSAETRMLRTADDFILLTNTPRLIVPTNLVTIQPTTLVTPNQLPVPSAPNLQSTSTNFGLQVSHLDLAHPSTSPPVRYAAYATLPPEQTVHTGLEPKGALVGNPKQLDGESAITPLWSPVSSTTISSSVLRIANSMQTMVPDLTTSLPTCVLTNTIQHLAPITAISVQGVTPMNLPDCSSVCISGTTLPISVNSASSKPAIVHARTMTTPAQPTLVFHNPAESRILLTQPSSYIGVLSHPLNWPSLTLASDETQQPNLRQTNSNWTGLKSSTPFSSEIEQSSTAHWQQLQATDHGDCPCSESALHQQPLVSEVPSSKSVSLQANLEKHCDLEAVKRAWSAMCHKTVWDNPNAVELTIDTKRMSTLQWRCAITNLWTDVLFRRIAVFVVALLGVICKQDGTYRVAKSDGPASGSRTHDNTDATENDGSTAGGIALTWADVIWLVKHRFSHCVPVLLIGCLQSGSHSSIIQKYMESDPSLLCFSHENDKPNIPNTRKGLSNPPETSKDSTDSPTELYAKVDADLHVASLRMKDSQGSCTQVDQSELSDLTDSHTNRQSLVYFQCKPGGHVYLSLTNLGHSLSRLTTSSGLSKDRNSTGVYKSPFPILQYLDAYIAQFSSFLACQPTLLGAFMALKLTDVRGYVPTQGVIGQGFKQIVGDHTRQRLQLMVQLHEHFIRVFYDAVDAVAIESSRESNLNQHVLPDIFPVSPREAAAARSRRAMLPDFLAWSRQFDTAWDEFQRDTWTQSMYRTSVSCGSKYPRHSDELEAIFATQSGNANQQCLWKMIADALLEVQALSD